MASKTAVKVKQDHLTIQQSKTLIKNMIRVNVSSICYYRDLFPPNCFLFKKYGNMQVVQLDAAEMNGESDIIIKDNKAFLLTQWLERGVFKVLEDGYLKSMTFAVYTTHPTTQEDLLVEAYEFKFSFTEEMKANINGVTIASKEDIKVQSGKFIKNLVFFAQSLDELPSDNWITIEIKYTSSIPEHYEIEFFECKEQSNLFTYSNNGVKLQIGKLETPFIKTEVKYFGLESLLYEDLSKISMNNLKNTTVESIKFKAPEDNSSFRASTFIEKVINDTSTKNNNINDYGLNDEDEGILNIIRAYVLRTCNSSAFNCSADLNYDRRIVSDAFKILEKEGILLKSGCGRYKFNKNSLAENSKKDIVQVSDGDESQTYNITPMETESHIIEIPNPPEKNKIEVDSSKYVTENLKIPESDEIVDTCSPFKGKDNVVNTKYVKPLLSLTEKNNNKWSKEHGKVDKKIIDTSNVLEKSSSKPEKHVAFSQDTDFSQETKPSSRKRLYGIIKDPIYIQRNWEKKSRMDVNLGGA